MSGFHSLAGEDELTCGRPFDATGHTRTSESARCTAPVPQGAIPASLSRPKDDLGAQTAQKSE